MELGREEGWKKLVKVCLVINHFDVITASRHNLNRLHSGTGYG